MRGFEGGDHPGRERLGDEGPELGVPGRVSEDQPVRAVPGAEHIGVGEHPLHHVVIEGQP